MKIRFAINRKIVNKAATEEDFRKLTYGYGNRLGTIEQLKNELARGYATASATLKDPDKGRNNDNFKSSDLLFLDFDNTTIATDDLGRELADDGGVWVAGCGKSKLRQYSGGLTLENALADPFIAEYAALVYDSPSSTDDWNKYRVVFILPQTCDDPELYRSLLLYLQSKYPQSDGSTKDLCRAWYGNNKGVFHVCRTVTLPDSFINEAVVYHHDRLAQEQRASEDRAKYLSEFSSDDPDTEKRVLLDALKHVAPRAPGTNTYNQSLSVLTAIKCVFGDSEGLAIAQQWSPSDGNGWNVEKKWAKLSTDGANYGGHTIVARAKEGGWRYPDWAKRRFEVEQINEGCMVASEFSKISEEFPAVLLPSEDEEIDEAEKSFEQIAKKAIFGNGHWICVDKVLYKWNINYYEKMIDADITPIIARFCEKYVEVVGSGKKQKLAHTKANDKSVKEILNWAKTSDALNPKKTNPPGINCINGVIEISWEGKKLITNFVKHDPTQHFYLAEPKVKYNPKANPEHYERLMQCLDAPEREIWEKTIASAIDLRKIREIGSRTVRALLLKGEGSNGKDALKLVSELIFGASAFASCSLTDWQQYDEGRCFSIYSMMGARVNWPSENADVGRIDKLQGLKAAITGNDVMFEAKGLQGMRSRPQTVFLFNLNETPELNAQLQALRTRFACIEFKKVYKEKPGIGELQADSRFADDPYWLSENVLPACLNRLLEQLQSVANNGIDYEASNAAMDAIQKESCHLLQFAEDVGLRYAEGEKIKCSTLWAELKDWYVENGVANILNAGLPSEKLEWIAQANYKDQNVKASHQIAKRFLEIFPKAKNVKETTERGKISYIVGLRMDPAKAF